MSTITFTSLGQGPDIGSNCYLITHGATSIVLDCGLHPKKEGLESMPNLDAIEEPPLAVLVSHAHIDHCGAVPRLMKRFPSVQAYATQPTLSIMDRMLHNSVSVMGTLSMERGIRDYPLYSHNDVEMVVRRTYGLDFEHEFALDWNSPIRARFHPSGHVLGSAGILLQMPGHTLYYSGDLCMNDQELMPAMAAWNGMPPVDTLVIESTRGAQDDDGQKQTFEGEIERFASAVEEVLVREGVALVPSFALGRSQEILNIIARLMGEGRLPEVPVYASGLGRAVYEIYNKYTEYLRPESNLRPLSEFRRIGDVWERSVRRELMKSPCIVVATSGMMVENTPSAMIAQEVVQDPRHGIFFIGYLDPDTPGYKLLHANVGDEILLEVSGHPVEILLENRRQFSFSAHASREELCRLVDRIAPKNVVFVHGDPEAVAWMNANCSGDYNRYIPPEADSIELDS